MLLSETCLVVEMKNMLILIIIYAGFLIRDVHSTCSNRQYNVADGFSSGSFSASSQQTLASNAQESSSSAWHPETADPSPYLQINMLTTYTVETIYVLGDVHTGDYVSTFKISYSFDGSTYIPYSSDTGEEMIFDRGAATTGDKMFILDNDIFGQYIRIHPITCSTECALRFDFDGCPCSSAYLPQQNVTGFYVSNLNENFVYLQNSGSETVTFTYETGANLVVLASLDTNETLLSTVDINNKRASVYVSSGRFPALGTYLLSTTLTTCTGSSLSKNLVVYHEEYITDFEVTNQYGGNFVPIGENTEFLITMSKGSNVQVEWMVDHNITTCLTDVPGIVRNITREFMFPQYAFYNITAFVRNSLSATYKILGIQALRRVSGFNVTTTPGLYETREVFNMTVSNDLQISYLQEMGEVYMDVVYGNGMNESFLISSFFNESTSFMASFSCQYMIQGNYNLTAVVRNPIDSQEFTFEFYAWDEINLTLSSAVTAEIGKPTTFEFINPPNAGFMYSMDYGDNSKSETNEAIWYKDNEVSQWMYDYLFPGVYTIQIVAWNPFYIVVQSYTITAQHPIPEMTFYPTDGDFPFPTGRTLFTLTMNENKPSPTDVDCTFDFGEYSLTRYGTILTYGVPLSEEYTYSTTGEKRVSFYCANLVSTMMKNATVNVTTYDIEDFTVAHPSVVGMNMTLSETNDTETNPFGISAIPVDVTVTAVLYRMRLMPPGLIFEWQFDKIGLPIEIPNPNFDYTNTFTARGFHECFLTVRNAFSESVTIPFNIVLGVVNFTADSYKGSPGRDSFTFSAVGLEGTGAYTFDLVIAVETKASSGSTPVTKSLTYPNRGRYLPTLLATNGTFVEFLYTPEHVGVDYVFEGINMTVPAIVALPTGETELIFGVPEGADPVFDITCTFISGDKIDRAHHSTTQNISDGNPIVYNYTYLTLGNHDFELNCENYAHKVSNSTIVSVRNKCYSINGIFDRQYSNKTTPMIVLTSKDIDLASRMLVYCPERGPKYLWQYYQVTEDDEIPFVYTPVFEPTGTVRFAKGTVPEGLYKVSLNVSLDDTWIKEYTFIRFERPKPYAYIVRGSKLITSITSMILQMDALTESYDAQLGHGYNNELTFTWYCSNIQSADIDVLNFYYATNFVDLDTLTPTNCSGLLEDDNMDGIATLNITSKDYRGYVVIVRVQKDDKYSFFTQLIQTVIGDPHDVSIVCLMNCQGKHAVTSMLSVQAVCNDCTATDYVTYMWTLRKYENGTYTEIDDLRNLTLTEIDKWSIVLKEGILEEGARYSLSVTVSSSLRDPALAMMDIFADYPPYNGTCYAEPKTGYASETAFSVICSDWLDEGTYLQRSYARDTSLNEPLVYQYTAYVTTLNNDGSTAITQVPLFKGSESTATELTLPVGSPTTSYYVDIEVRIYDRYGDFVVFTSTDTRVTVISNPEMIPVNHNDLNATDNLFSLFDRNYNITEAGGNSMAVVRLVGSTVSVYMSADLQYSSNITSQDDLLTGSANPSTVTTTTPVFPVQQELISRTRQFTKILLDSTSPAVTSDDSAISTADVRQVARSLATCVAVPSYVDDQTLDYAAESTDTLMDNIRKVSETNPFPIEDTINIQDSADGVVGVLSSLIDIAVPQDIYDLDSTLTTEDIRAELDQYTFYNQEYQYLSDMDADAKDQLVEALYQVRTTARERQQQQSLAAQTSVPKMISAIRSTLIAKSKIAQVGAGVDIVEKGNIDVSVEKERKDVLLNNSVARMDVDIEFDYGELSSSETNSLELRVAAFKKDPYFYASGSSLVTSTVISVEAYDENQNDINIQKDLKFQNKGTAHFKNYFPANISDGIDAMFYFVSDLKASDAVLVYIKPDDFLDSGNMEDVGLYSVYVKTGDHPTSSEYTYMKQVEALDWEDPLGFKVFIPDKILGRGRVFIGIKPRNVPTTDTSGNSKRKRRCASGCASSTFNPPDSNFSIAIATTGCRSYDGSTNSWVDTGCSVLDLSTLNETICRCPNPPSSTFSTTFYVPPNKIDFNTVWSKFDPANAAVYGTVIGLIVLYFLVFPWLRRQDKYDLSRWATRFLCDTENTDCYFYLLTVQTGMRRESGTESNVNFIISGEESDTGARVLADGYDHGFPSSSIKTFLMGTKAALGELTYLRIWHDNAGTGDLKSWYLHKVMVDDLQQNKRYIFLCDRWLAIEQDDGMVERILPVCSSTNLKNFDQLISQQARFNATENHLWLSMMIRPQRSSFSRVQRLSCAFALLFLTMIASAMFFRSSEEVRPDQVSIGILRFSLTTVYISFISILIATVPIFLVTYIFKTCRPKSTDNKKSRELENALDETLKNSELTSNATANVRDDGSVEFIKEEKLPLPHWAAYIGWFILFLAVVTSAFFLILYSMEWGKDKSEEWLSTFFFSFAESLFILDPLNVILMSVLVAVLFRKPVDGDCPAVDLDKIKSAVLTHREDSARQYTTFRMQILARAGPPTESALEDERKIRQSEVEAQAVLRRLLIYSIYVFIIFSISYINRDARSYDLKKNIENQIYFTGARTFGFENINTTKGYFLWLNETFFPNYFPTMGFSDNPLGVLDKLYFSDMANARVGPARLRQLRLRTKTCDYIIDPNYPCVDEYDEDREDRNDHCVGWGPYNSTCVMNAGSYFTSDAWKYKSSSDIWGMPYIGKHKVYDGGGYVLTFDLDLANSRFMLNELYQNRWIDRQTRAVFLEFTLYNPNINLFLYNVFLAEFFEVGGCLIWTDLQAFRPYQSLGAVGTYALVCYFIYLIFLIVAIVRMILQIRKIGCAYFKNTWNLVDVLCSLLGLVAIFLWAARLKYANEALDKYYNDKRTFITFQHIVAWDNSFVIVMSIMVFIATVRILQILGYNRRMTQLVMVITDAASELLGFSVVFGIIYFAYVVAGYLLFGPNTNEYRSIFVSFGSLTNSIIGKNHLNMMTISDPLLAEIYYMTYIFLVILILISMFAVILNQSISMVKEELQDEDVYGLTNVVSDSLKDILGIIMSLKPQQKSTHHPLTKAGDKYKVTARKPDFDTPNIVDLLQEILRQYGGETVKKSEESYPYPQEEKGDLFIDSPGQKDTSPNAVDDVQFSFEDRDMKKVEQYSAFI